MEQSIFGNTDPHLEEDPWKLPSPRLGAGSDNDGQPWSTNLSEEENSTYDNENNNGIGHNKDHRIDGLGVTDDPLGSNILSGSQIIENKILADDELTSRLESAAVINYEEDVELNNNIWDIELTNSFDPLGFHNSSDKSFIRVKEIPEKEGLVFKHINYLISHNIKFAGDTTNVTKNSKGDIKIIRRYSDFYWLFEVLLKKYPFRAIPELPPKKFNGSSTSNDSLFLQNRRRGLQRFLNQLIKHPILNKENLVIMFLTVPNDFNNWKKFAKIDLGDELDGIKFTLPQKYKLKYKTTPREEYEEDTQEEPRPELTNEQIYKNIEVIWDENDNKASNFMSNCHKLHQNLGKLADLWGKLTILVERMERRQIAMANDERRFETVLKNFADNDNKIFQMDKLVDISQQSQLYNFETEETQNLNIINSILLKIPIFYQQRQHHQNEELSNLNSNHLENFKKFQDYLIAFSNLLDRLILFKVTTERANALIVSRLIKANEKLQLWLRKPDIRGSDFDKLNNFINLQILELNKNLYKTFLVKNCVKFEFKLFNKLKYLLSEIFQDWFAEKVKYGNIYGDLLEKCFNELQELPLR